VELCGGTHTPATGNIGYTRLISESAIAAGVRRIEAVTGKQSEEIVNRLFHVVDDIKQILRSPNIMQALKKLSEENEKFRKEIEEFALERVHRYMEVIDKKIENINGYHIISNVSDVSPDILKQAASKIRNYKTNLVVVLASNQEQKPSLVIALSDDLVAGGLSAAALIREVAPMIEGGGGGQPPLAAAGGKNCDALEGALKRVLELVTMR
jgi:alanyl-tRNA synthetase